MTRAQRELVRLSKRLALVLRHDPASVGLALDQAGWADVEELLAALATHGTAIDRATLDQVVQENSKRRYAFDESGTRIRASQGHSVPVELGLPPVAPPALLYHGTVADALPAIRADGLLPMARHHVHLSATPDTAAVVGSRRGRPVVLTVGAARMAAAGHVFYRSANGVWLVAHVPPDYLTE